VKRQILTAAAVIPAYLMVGAVWVVYSPAWIRHRGWEWITKKGGMMKRLYVAMAAMVIFSGCASMPDFKSAPTTFDLSWIEKAQQLVSKYWPEIGKSGEDEFNPPGMPNYVPKTAPISCCWLNGGAWRMMNESADSVDMVAFKRHVDEAKAKGCNTYVLFLHNIKDGRPVPTTIYETGALGGKVSQARIDLLKEKAAYVAKQGMMIIWFVFGDDGGIPYKDEALVKAFFGDLKTYLYDQINGAWAVVLVIESDEVFDSGGRKYVEAYCAELQGLFPGPSIGNHMTSGEYDWSMECASVDIHFHQVNPKKSVTACESELRKVVSKATKPVVDAESSLHGDSDEAREKSTRAMQVGCVGVLSGVPKD